MDSKHELISTSGVVILSILVTSLVVGIQIPNYAMAEPRLLTTSGKITFLRVTDLTQVGFGPPSDFINVDVVIKLNTSPENAYGFTLRNDQNLPAHQGMLSLLQDAFKNDYTIFIDFTINLPQHNGVISRVALIK